MPTLLCPECGVKLKVPEEFARATARCPSCRATIAVNPPPAPAAPPKPAARDDQYAMQHDERTAPKPERRRPVLEDEERPRRSAEPVARAREEEDERPRKKPRRKRRPAAASEGMPVWAWWAGAVCGYLLLLVLAAMAAAAAGHREMVFIYGVVLAVMIPISTVILIFSMIISSWVLGGIDFGEVHLVILKSVLLLLLVNTLGLLPIEGILGLVILPALTLLTWWLGLMYFFDIDFTEARILIGVNWALNFLVKWFLVAIIIAALMRVGPAGLDGLEFGPEPPPTQEGKDLDHIDRLGGDFESDDNQPDDPVVLITLARSRATDADLALLKRFPKLHTLNLAQTAITDAGLAHIGACPALRRLDLSATRITDAGLPQLHGLRQLEQLTLVGTRVTDTGVQGLRQALPRTKVVLR